MVDHHLLVVDSALFGVLCLHEVGEFPEEGPRIEVKLFIHILEFDMKNDKYSIFDEVLFGPLKPFGRIFGLGSSYSHDFEGSLRNELHVCKLLWQRERRENSYIAAISSYF